jgi:hypothetical protein
MNRFVITIALAFLLLATACQRPPAPNPIRRGIRSSGEGMAIDGVPEIQNRKRWQAIDLMELKGVEIRMHATTDKLHT